MSVSSKIEVPMKTGVERGLRMRRILLGRYHFQLGTQGVRQATHALYILNTRGRLADCKFKARIRGEIMVSAAPLRVLIYSPQPRPSSHQRQPNCSQSFQVRAFGPRAIYWEWDSVIKSMDLFSFLKDHNFEFAVLLPEQCKARLEWKVLSRDRERAPRECKLWGEIILTTAGIRNGFKEEFWVLPWKANTILMWENGFGPEGIYAFGRSASSKTGGVKK